MQYCIDMCSSYEYCPLIYENKKKYFYVFSKITIEQIELDAVKNGSILGMECFPTSFCLWFYFEGPLGMKSTIYFECF